MEQGDAGVCYGPGRALQRGLAKEILQDSASSWGVQPGDLPKTPGFPRKDELFLQIGQCFLDIGDPSCIWLQGPEVKLLSGEPFH